VGMVTKSIISALFKFLYSICPKRILGSAALTIAACLWASAQSDLEEANIRPRTPSVSTVASASVVLSNVDLVLLNVTVLDRADRAVTGLQSRDFAVLDDNKPQTVRYISNVDEPASLVIVLDASASMAPKIEAERNAVKELINSSNPQDEFSLVVLNDKPHLLFGFDDPVADMQAAVAAIQPTGFTALWDGIYLGVQELRNAHNRRQAMIVISDGGDNHSRYTESDLKSVLEEAHAEMYAIGIFDSSVHTFEERLGPSQLDELASVTGGRLFSLRDVRDLPQTMMQISWELRNQYLLGYYAGKQDRDGKWHKVKVRLCGRASETKYRLYSKKGYYATAQ
jgi:Ca-activated chloride channel homolog